MPLSHANIRSTPNRGVLRVIPKTRDRYRLLFLLLYSTGMRVGEALTIEGDDLDGQPRR